MKSLLLSIPRLLGILLYWAIVIPLLLFIFPFWFLICLLLGPIVDLISCSWTTDTIPAFVRNLFALLHYAR